MAQGEPDSASVCEWEEQGKDVLQDEAIIEGTVDYRVSRIFIETSECEHMVM
jgi:hypothetical protein